MNLPVNDRGQIDLRLILVIAAGIVLGVLLLSLLGRA